MCALFYWHLKFPKCAAKIEKSAAKFKIMQCLCPVIVCYISASCWQETGVIFSSFSMRSTIYCFDFFASSKGGQTRGCIRQWKLRCLSAHFYVFSNDKSYKIPFGNAPFSHFRVLSMRLLFAQNPDFLPETFCDRGIALFVIKLNEPKIVIFRQW